ncbi:MAG: FAD:protein FMN transferase [Pseudomonadota bacterium]
MIEITGLSMGTTYNVAAVDKSGKINRNDLQNAVSTALNDVIATMSNWDDASEISRLNAALAGQFVAPSAALAEVLTAAQEVNAATDGRFDTTVGPLVELWGFGAGATGSRAKPNEEEIAAAQARSGFENTIALRDGGVEKRRDDGQIYLAGIGKGYGADHVGRAIEALGVTDYLVEIGGDIYAAGRNPDGQPWQIGIELPNPSDSGLAGVVGLSGLGMASSGDYRNYFEAEGQRYSHLIDPVTGYPVNHNTASATVLAANAMLADAWSTAMLILGREQGLEVAAKHAIAVQFIERNANEGAQQFSTFTSDAFDTLTA